MTKRHFWLSTFIVLGVVLAGSSVLAQGIVPSTASVREGTSNNSIPYNATSFRNVCYMQFVAPGEFCTNPPDQWNGGSTPGSGALEPAMIGGLAIRPDGYLANIFTASATRPDAGTFHFLTDLQNNANFLYFQDSSNWNATTVTYPGGFTLNFPTPPSGSLPYPAREFTPITSTTGVFTYLGTLTGCCGSCPAPAQGGLMINARFVNGTGSGLFYADFESIYATVGIHYNSIRLWGVGAGATGFNNWVNYFAGLVYSFDVGGCKTYSDLKDEVLNADISDNPPSDPTVNPPYGIGGLRNSYWKQCVNSEAAFNRGSFGSAGNGLGAMSNHVAAQDGKHLASDSAQDLQNCIRSLRSTLGI